MKRNKSYLTAAVLITVLAAVLLVPSAGCRRRATRLDLSEKAAVMMWKVPGYPIRLFPKNKTIEMYTHNTELGPYMASFNSEGVRDKDYTPEKPPGTVRIVVLGDSFMFGWGVEQNETFSSRLTQIYAQKAGPKVEVINLAIPGFNHISELNILKAVGLNYHPDVVLLLANKDDMFPDNNNYFSGNMPHLTGEFAPLAKKDPAEQTKARFILRLTKAGTAAEFRKSGYDVLFGEFVRKPITEMYELGKQRGFRLVIISLVNSPLKENYFDLASRLGIQILDLNAFIELQAHIPHSSPVPPMMIPGDGHPTPPALALYAQFVARDLALPKPSSPATAKP